MHRFDHVNVLKASLISLLPTLRCIIRYLNLKARRGDGITLPLVQVLQRSVLQRLKLSGDQVVADNIAGAGAGAARDAWCGGADKTIYPTHVEPLLSSPTSRPSPSTPSTLLAAPAARPDQHHWALSNGFHHLHGALLSLSAKSP
jgi:hypothetical protein